MQAASHAARCLMFRISQIGGTNGLRQRKATGGSDGRPYASLPRSKGDRKRLQPSPRPSLLSIRGRDAGAASGETRVRSPFRPSEAASTEPSLRQEQTGWERPDRSGRWITVRDLLFQVARHLRQTSLRDLVEFGCPTHRSTSLLLSAQMQ